MTEPPTATRQYELVRREKTCWEGEGAVGSRQGQDELGDDGSRGRRRASEAGTDADVGRVLELETGRHGGWWGGGEGAVEGRQEEDRGRVCACEVEAGRGRVVGVGCRREGRVGGAGLSDRSPDASRF